MEGNRGKNWGMANYTRTLLAVGGSRSHGVTNPNLKLFGSNLHHIYGAGEDRGITMNV